MAGRRARGWSGRWSIGLLNAEKLAKAYEGVEAFVGGIVEGEVIGVGLWVAVDTLQNVNDETDLFRLPQRRLPRLIRWSLIENAVVYESKPSQSEMGFRSR